MYLDLKNKNKFFKNKYNYLKKKFFSRWINSINSSKNCFQNFWKYINRDSKNKKIYDNRNESYSLKQFWLSIYQRKEIKVYKKEMKLKKNKIKEISVDENSNKIFLKEIDEKIQTYLPIIIKKSPNNKSTGPNSILW